MDTRMLLLYQLVIVAAAIAIIVPLAIKLGYLFASRNGYNHLGNNTIVRCSVGHVFTTIWIPGASLKAVRLGMKRYQRCPLCDQWRIVVPLKDAELTDEIMREAAKYRDSSVF